MIRHKATQQLMPLAQRNRGYSHWNPNSNTEPLNIFLKIPRFLSSEEQARRVIHMWYFRQNGKQYSDEFNDLVDYKPDERKKDDLEIIEVMILNSDGTSL